MALSTLIWNYFLEGGIRSSKLEAGAQTPEWLSWVENTMSQLRSQWQGGDVRRLVWSCKQLKSFLLFWASHQKQNYMWTFRGNGRYYSEELSVQQTHFISSYPSSYQYLYLSKPQSAYYFFLLETVISGFGIKFSPGEQSQSLVCRRTTLLWYCFLSWGWSR